MFGVFHVGDNDAVTAEIQRLLDWFAARAEDLGIHVQAHAFEDRDEAFKNGQVKHAVLGVKDDKVESELGDNLSCWDTCVGKPKSKRR